MRHKNKIINENRIKYDKMKSDEQSKRKFKVTRTKLITFYSTVVAKT